jgi:chromosome segregation ATPase
MFNRKLHARIAELEARNLWLDTQLDQRDEKIGDLMSEGDRLRHTIRAARATAARSRSTYQTLTMPYQHLSSTIAVLDGKDPLA